MKKRITVLALISALLLSACSGNSGDSTETTTAAETAAATSAVITEVTETSETTAKTETTGRFLTSGETETDDGWIYTIDDYNGISSATITGYTGADTEIVIPADVDGYPVTCIDNLAFRRNEEITGVTFPETMEIIDNNAFSDCINLENVIIPETIKQVSSDSFSGTPWFERQCEENDILIIGSVLLHAANISGEYTIPRNITYIADWAFEECEGITSVTIPENVTGIGAGAFNGCCALETVSIPSTITEIDYLVFADCTSLNNVIIPDSVTAINSDAFSGCESLTGITIPGTVTSIGTEVFENTPWLAEKRNENPLVVVNGILIDGKTASGDVVIPENVTKICEYSFYENTDITSVIIPGTVTEIEANAFNECTALKSVTMADGVQVIGAGAFADCTGLENIVFSKNLTDLGYFVFYDCPKLTGFTVPDELDIDVLRYTFGTNDEEYPIEAEYKGTTWIFDPDEHGFVNSVQSAER